MVKLKKKKKHTEKINIIDSKDTDFIFIPGDWDACMHQHMHDKIGNFIF